MRNEPRRLRGVVLAAVVLGFAGTTFAVDQSESHVVRIAPGANVTAGLTRAPDRPVQYRAAEGGGFTSGPTRPIHLQSSGGQNSGGASNLSPAPTSPKNLGSFNLVINAGTTLANNAPALAAFNRAANQWKAFISDPITVTVDADLAGLPTNVLGSTSSLNLQAGYNTIRNQLVTDSALDPDDSIMANTPTAAQFSSSVLLTTNTLSGSLVLSKAAAKAEGFTGLDEQFGTSDGSITFATGFTFDYDNSNGVTAGTIDFESVASHEIGHVLGFTSAVDDEDQSTPPQSISPTTLDVLRFLTGSTPLNASQFATTARHLVPNTNEAFSDTNSVYRMSTGAAMGDGNQASHWKADEITGINVGVMDPTLAFGQIEQITGADRRAMDLIGYDILIPEPSSALLMAVVACGFAGRRRRSTLH